MGRERANSSSVRVFLVFTTDKGKETVAGIMENYTLYLDNVLKGIDPQQISKISETLKMLVDALQKILPFDSAINI